MCACKKARQKIGVLYRKFYHADTPTLQQLYILCIRPHFKHAVLVLDPYRLGLVNTLENVQNFALKVCMYKDRNQTMKACSLLVT